MFVLFILIGLAVVVSLPYSLAGYHQLRMLRRLRKRAEACGFRYGKRRKLPWLPRNFRAAYDFSLEGENTVYLVKLMAAYGRSTDLIIRSDGRVATRSRRRKPMEIREDAEPAMELHTGRFRSVPKTKLTFKLPEGKRPVFVLLTHPTFRRILRQNGRQLTPVLPGEPLFEKRMATPSVLEKWLQEGIRWGKNDDKG